MIVSRYFRELAKCVTNNEISASLLPLYAASPMVSPPSRVLTHSCFKPYCPFLVVAVDQGHEGLLPRF